jgi:16S rRNA (uracil1498-N3)-methyltransferase
MPPRLFVDHPLHACGGVFDLPAAAARHVQVLRLQPGDPLIVFDGLGGQWQATVLEMGRRSVRVERGAHDHSERELQCAVTLAVGMPANERFDWLVEKATELGAAALQPLVCERSVLRLSGERAERKREHWRGVAIAAAEQSGRTRVPEVNSPRNLVDWLNGLPPVEHSAASAAFTPLADTGRWLLSPTAARRWRATEFATLGAPVLILSGPEGGFSAREEAEAIAAGFAPVQLGPRILRAETAPLVALVNFAA